MSESDVHHLTPDEIELWAEGLLPAARALNLAQCPACLAAAERERQFFLQLAQLERFAPSAAFTEKVLGHVKLPTPSGGHERR